MYIINEKTKELVDKGELISISEKLIIIRSEYSGNTIRYPYDDYEVVYTKKEWNEN